MVLIAVEGGAGPGAYGFGDEVVAADQSGSVDVEGLSAAMGVDLLGEGCLESPPLLDGSFSWDPAGAARWGIT